MHKKCSINIYCMNECEKNGFHLAFGVFFSQIKYLFNKIWKSTTKSTCIHTTKYLGITISLGIRCIFFLQCLQDSNKSFILS